MPQDRETGAEANDYGRNTARQIGAAIGAQMVRPGSNECVYENERVVIKCARASTTKVGVSYQMLNHLDGVLGAFENPDGSYRIVRLPANVYRNNMEPTRSTGPSNGRVGVVNRAVFDQHGTVVGVVRV
jgi:hypothetical protein